jgi:glycine cleavage system H lipoate-binding protein
MDSSTSEYTIAKTQYENNKTVYESLYGKVDDLQAEQDHVSKKYIDLKSEYNAYDSKIQDLDVFLNNASKDISQLGTYVKQLGITYDQKLAKANQIKSEADAALKVITDERDKALKSINTEISLCSQRDRITAQKEKIAKLEAESVGASVKSPVAGIVSSVNKVAGESTSADETIAVIQVDGKDMTTSFSVSNSQAQKLKVGDAAQPQNAWQFSSDFKATLTSIKNDKQDPAGKKLLTFKIESTEVTPGQSLSLAIGERSQNYDMIVPNSAIKTDTNGKFVLIVKSKSSPLGNRYTATRADVTVVASDDKNSAITAAIDDYEYVITTANKPVKAGEQVRLSNE